MHLKFHRLWFLSSRETKGWKVKEGACHWRGCFDVSAYPFAQAWERNEGTIGGWRYMLLREAFLNLLCLRRSSWDDPATGKDKEGWYYKYRNLEVCKEITSYSVFPCLFPRWDDYRIFLIQRWSSLLHLMCVWGGGAPHLGTEYKVAGGQAAAVAPALIQCCGQSCSSCLPFYHLFPLSLIPHLALPFPPLFPPPTIYPCSSAFQLCPHFSLKHGSWPQPNLVAAAALAGPAAGRGKWAWGCVGGGALAVGGKVLVGKSSCLPGPCYCFAHYSSGGRDANLRWFSRN